VRMREYCVRTSGRCNPVCRAADLRMLARMKVMSIGIDDTGNVHIQSIDIACKDGNIWGTAGIVSQSSLWTAGINAGRSEKSK